MDDLLSNQYCFECGCFDSYGIQDSNEGIEAFGDRVANQEIKTDNQKLASKVLRPAHCVPKQKYAEERLQLSFVNKCKLEWE